MKLVDRYLLRELLIPFAFGVAAFTSILFAGGFLFDLMKMVSEQQARLLDVARLVIYHLPTLVVVTFPMSVLLAVLLAVGRLSGESELVACYAGGISLWRLLTPLLVFGVLVAGLTLLFNEMVVPTGAERYEMLKQALSRGKPGVQQDIVTRDPSGGPPARIIFAREFDLRRSALRDLDLFEYSKGRLVVVVHCAEAIWRGSHWELYEGFVQSIQRPLRREPTGGNPAEPKSAEDARQRGVLVFEFSSIVRDLGKTPEDIAREQKKPRDMSAKELREEMEALQQAGAQVSRLLAELQVQWHLRFAIPLASLAFVLVAAPLSLRRQRTSGALGLGLSVLIIFAYYVLLNWTRILGERGVLPAAPAAWTANVVTGVLGIVLLWRASR